MTPTSSGLLAHLPGAGIFSPMQIEFLARAVLERERLPWQELPRCRREIRLQLLLAGVGVRRSLGRRRAPAALWRRSSSAV